ncbi:MAG TPA: tetratricopeptide repeat protein [Gemmatimonadaceae bacterium]|nr:tetratricopeptide repeat protein [Gemmatimonadaceae bacterium]
MTLIIDALKAAQREKARRRESPDQSFAPVLIKLRTQPRRQLPRSYLFIGGGAIGVIALSAVLWTQARNETALPAVPPLTSAILNDALADSVAASKPIVQQAARVGSVTPLPVRGVAGSGAVPTNTTRTSSAPAIDRPQTVARAAAPAMSPTVTTSRESPANAPVNRSGRLDIAVEAPRNADAARLFSEAVAAHRAGALDLAKPLYERVLTLSPRDGDALNNLGVILSEEKNFDRALDLLRRATAASPRNAGAWNNIGAVLREQGRAAEAIEAFRQALVIDPTHLGARVGLAQQYLAGSPATARELLLPVLQGNPSLAEAHYTMGQAQERLGDRAAAIASYAAFIRYAPARLAGHVELVRKRMEALEQRRDGTADSR